VVQKTRILCGFFTRVISVIGKTYIDTNLKEKKDEYIGSVGFSYDTYDTYDTHPSWHVNPVDPVPPQSAVRGITTPQLEGLRQIQ
jgi:hypothetical protein